MSSCRFLARYLGNTEGSELLMEGAVCLFMTRLVELYSSDPRLRVNRVQDAWTYGRLAAGSGLFRVLSADK
jgi:hypothetical protein